MQKRLLIIVASFVLLVVGFLSSSFSTEQSEAKANKKMSQSTLDQILKNGKLRVGTPGDYKPFTYLNPKTKQYEGYDIDAAKKLAADLGVKVEFVKTTWPTLMQDLQAGKFDIGMGGITRTLERQKTAHLSPAIIKDGKSPLIRKADEAKFKNLADIDVKGVKIGVNPGGTNEKFVRANIKNAEIVLIQNNLDIPPKVASGEVDVMITDSTEARYYASQDERLLAIMTDHPFDVHTKGYLLNRDDVAWQNFVQLWVEQMNLLGEFDKLEKKWMN